MMRDKIFISYSHQDQELLDEFRTHLGYWSKEGQILMWSDQGLETRLVCQSGRGPAVCGPGQALAR